MTDSRPRRPPGSLLDQIADQTIEQIRSAGTYRQLRELRGPQGATIQLDGAEVVHFAGSNYLDLAHHPQVVQAAADAAAAYGCAVAGSRLICGNLDLHAALESELASFLGFEAALVYSSGYMANLGVLPCLLRESDVVVSDALNHASIVDACRLSRAEVRVFPHGDLNALEALLREIRRHAPSDRRVLLVLDGVYSMDGDVPQLPAMIALAREHGALVMLDDAHGFGTLGPNGRGAGELLGVHANVDVYVGTLGKALGSFGAFVAGSARLRELLINASRTFIFTCALSAPQVAAARAALTVMQREPERRQALQANADRLRSRLQAAGIDTAPSTTQIIPVVLRDNARTMRVSERLLARGFYAQGIRHPSVPRDTARLRITLMSSHTQAQIDTFARAVAEEAEEAANVPGSLRGSGVTGPAT